MIFIIIIFSKTVTMISEVKARIQIDHLLQSAGWHVCNIDQVNLHAALGVAIREFPLNSGHGFADYLLYVNGKACGVIEAKKEDVTLKGVEAHAERHCSCSYASLKMLVLCRSPLNFVDLLRLISIVS
jgi:type I restriction enzyme R subunit